MRFFIPTFLKCPYCKSYRFKGAIVSAAQKSMKKVRSETAPSSVLQPFRYLCAVLEKERRSAFWVDRQILHEGVPQPFAEIYRQRLHPAYILDESVEDFDLPLFPFLAVRNCAEIFL